MIKNDLNDKIIAEFFSKIPDLEELDSEGFKKNIVDTYKQYTGFNYDLLKTLPSQELMNLLTNERINDFSRVLIVSVLLFIEGTKDDNYSNLYKSFEIFKQSLDKGFDIEESQFRGELLKLMESLREYELPEELQLEIFSYYKDLKQYADAEDTLYELAENNPEYIPALTDYYNFLLSLGSEVLAEEDITKEEIRESLNEIIDRT
ncbi:MAG: DUF6483 family protein [Clostridiaceae bacterium]